MSSADFYNGKIFVLALSSATSLLSGVHMRPRQVTKDLLSKLPVDTLWAHVAVHLTPMDVATASMVNTRADQVFGSDNAWRRFLTHSRAITTQHPFGSAPRHGHGMLRREYASRVMRADSEIAALRRTLRDRDRDMRRALSEVLSVLRVHAESAPDRRRVHAAWGTLHATVPARPPGVFVHRTLTALRVWVRAMRMRRCDARCERRLCALYDRLVVHGKALSKVAEGL